jgi:hypothetical protein
MVRDLPENVLHMKNSKRKEYKLPVSRFNIFLKNLQCTGGKDFLEKADIILKPYYREISSSEQNACV